MHFTKLKCKFLILIYLTTVFAGPEEDEGVRYADRCEACKILATELQGRLTETGKSHDVLEMGQVNLIDFSSLHCNILSYMQLFTGRCEA